MWKIAVVGVILSGAGWAQVTQRVSVATGGVQGNGASDFPSISADGRYVAFDSLASNLVGGDTNGASDIFVHDRLLGTTELVSVDSLGIQGDKDSIYPSISADGRYVAFESFATNLVGGDNNGFRDIFVRDRQLGTTERVSVDSGGAQAIGQSEHPSISAEGRCVAFWSDANNLVGGDTNGTWDVFVHDRPSGTTERVSVDSTGAQAFGNSFDAVVSADGRYVAFWSDASNLVIGDMNGHIDIFVRDRQAGTTELVSVDSVGTQGDGDSLYPAISADGRYVAFYSDASNLVGGADTDGVTDVFVRDRQLGTTERVSIASGGTQGNGPSVSTTGTAPSISAAGGFVVFESFATNLVSGDTNGVEDFFVRDRQLGTTERVSVATGGTQANSSSYYVPSISADGRYVTFTSFASNLVSGDTNGWADIFVHDRDATFFTSLCEPGLDGVIVCPCGNPPTGPGRGCDNFAPLGGTGGARLDGSGTPSLGLDTVTLDISDTLKQIHVLFVGTTLSANVRAGAGVRCVNDGANLNAQDFLKRIMKQTPTNGPPSTMSFTGIQAASAAKGAPPIAGETYYYYAAYRNAAANGQPGCLGLSFGFNATNAGAVTWYP